MVMQISLVGKSIGSLNRESLKNLLLSFQGKSMSEQKETLAQEFQNWKGNKEQIDDITIFAVKL